MAKELRILRIADLAEKLSIGESTIYDWLSPKSPRHNPDFPKPIRLGASSIGWLSTVVDQWLMNQYLEQHNQDITELVNAE